MPKPKATRRPVLIAFDPTVPRSDERMTEMIREFGPCWHHARSTWIVLTSLPPTYIRDRLIEKFSVGEKLLVTVLGGAAAWEGFSPAAAKWLQDVVVRLGSARPSIQHNPNT